MVLYEYMNSLRNDVCNLYVNTHVRIKIYREFYHCIIYIANEGRHVRIVKSLYSLQIVRKSKDWLARNQDDVSEWGDMSIRGLLFQWASTIKIHLSVFTTDAVEYIPDI
jgi:hypothetical protein